MYAFVECVVCCLLISMSVGWCIYLMQWCTYIQMRYASQGDLCVLGAKMQEVVCPMFGFMNLIYYYKICIVYG